MEDFPLNQLFGAITGGMIGGFSGFVASTIHAHRQLRRLRRNVASALIGEIGGLSAYIAQSHIMRHMNEMEGEVSQDHSYHYFRGERDYTPVFRSLGVNVGHLPSPLPRELVDWYTRLAVCLENARELHEVALERDPERVQYALHVRQIQENGFRDLVTQAPALLERLSSL